MDKKELVSLLTEYGDAIITYVSQNSNKSKYNVCTIDFENDYIKKKRCKAKVTGDTILTFCWDTDTFRLIRPSNVTSVQALGNALKNYGHYL